MTLLEQTEAALDLVADERARQIIKWGVQHHPDGTGSMLMKAQAEIDRSVCEEAFAHGNGTWRHILKEEFSEAMAESDTDKLLVELTHVAAVAVSWIEDIRSRVTEQ